MASSEPPTLGHPPNRVYDMGSCEEHCLGALRSSLATKKPRAAELGPGRPGEGASALHCRLEPVCLGAGEGDQRLGPVGDLTCPLLVVSQCTGAREASYDMG